MNWPTFEIAPSVPRQKQYEATRRAKKEAFKQEVESLRLAQAARAPKPPAKSICDPDWEEFISGAGFKSWYEEVTCKSGDKYAAFLLSSDAHIYFGQTRTEWIADRIRSLLEDNRWQSPSYRRYWAKRIYECVSPLKRRAIIIRLATPRWADLVKVARFHRQRAAITLETGIAHHVDHIIPLQGVHVCGLNNEFNLRVIPALENMQKSNKYIQE